ncbi:hypothetical protein AVEN_52262-1 [Araneus ventricosus]|uniref:Uncharacterized protein n=1 Tax=Araneus ventricosus TaxID=182803 RepID=A0A4Y2PM66_ARAVE|nr:hypothetical protein AVEN_52262-1 [Araneus ventricosus]
MSSQSAAVEIQTTALPEGHHVEVGYQSPSKAVPYMPMTTLLDSPGRSEGSPSHTLKMGSSSWSQFGIISKQNCLTLMVGGWINASTTKTT